MENQPKKVTRRGFLERLGFAAAAGLVTGGMHSEDAEAKKQEHPSQPEMVHADLKAEIKENEETIEALSKIDDAFLQKINSQSFDASVDHLEHVGQVEGAGAGALLGGVTGALVSHSSVEEPKEIASAVAIGAAVGGVIGAVGGGEMAAHVVRVPQAERFILEKRRTQGAVTNRMIEDEITRLREKNTSLQIELDHLSGKTVELA